MTQFLHAYRIYEQLPMKSVSHLPDEGWGLGMLTVTRDGRQMEVTVKPKPAPGVRWGHRVMIKCPECGRAIPFGRMCQHWPTHERSE